MKITKNLQEIIQTKIKKNLPPIELLERKTVSKLSALILIKISLMQDFMEKILLDFGIDREELKKNNGPVVSFMNLNQRLVLKFQK